MTKSSWKVSEIFSFWVLCFFIWKFRVVMTKFCFIPPERKKQLPKLWRLRNFNFVSVLLWQTICFPMMDLYIKLWLNSLTNHQEKDPQLLKREDTCTDQLKTSTQYLKETKFKVIKQKSTYLGTSQLDSKWQDLIALGLSVGFPSCFVEDRILPPVPCRKPKWQFQ